MCGLSGGDEALVLINAGQIKQWYLILSFHYYCHWLHYSSVCVVIVVDSIPIVCLLRTFTVWRRLRSAHTHMEITSVRPSPNQKADKYHHR